LEWLSRFRRSGVALPLLAAALLIIYFSSKNSLFFTLDNARNIGQQSSVLLLVALAGTVVILIGSIDLSVGAIVTVTGILCASMIDGSGPVLAVVCAIAIGVGIGLINGALMVGLRIPSFLVTLGMLSILTGIANKAAGGAPVLFSDQAFSDAVNGEAVLGIPNVVVLALATVALLWFVSFRTRFGRYLFAIGGGEGVAALSGVPVNRYKVAAFAVAGALCGLAGALVTGQVGAGTPGIGSPYLLDSIAAVVMGGTALSGGVGGPHRTVIGVFVIAVLSNGMDVTQVDDFTQDIVKGLVIIVAVALTIDRSKYSVIK
jgi:ribose transport system permease protein/putative xylitol transport system permease protein